ncbi:hypothetical protein GCM10009809_13870 [Isoptericola hypogeus]|uniref:Dockerin domain-containing protein n=1 Tax=Isoptericola hypogeus TaxID=300179 RepID=A0ABP4V787_9MICO
MVGAADTAKAGPGDVVTYTLTAHDLKAWGSFNTQLRFDSKLIKLLSVEPTDELAAHDPTPVEVTTKDAGSGTWKFATASFDVGDTAGLTADELPLLTVSYEVLDADGWSLENSLVTSSTSYTSTDGTKAQLQQFYGAVERLNPLSHLSGRVAPEAMLTDAYAFDPAFDYTTAGSTVTLTAPDGTVRTAEVDATSRFGFGGLPLTDEAYRLEVRVPGHFTWYEDVAGGAASEGGQVVSTVPALSTGDVNADDVVDVRDAIAILEAKGTTAPAADLDRSGSVDRADLAWVRTNYRAQNPTSDRITTPVTSYRGTTLEDVEDRM